MPAALTDFFDGFTRAHAVEGVHPVIQAMDAHGSLLGLPAGVLNQAIADHHPLAATSDEVTVVVAHAEELMSHDFAAEPGSANRPEHRAT